MINFLTRTYGSTSWPSKPGDVELNAEPTTYTTAANMENVLSSDIYILPATSANAGLVDLNAQNFAGLKIFNDGLRLDDAAGQTTLDYYCNTALSSFTTITGAGTSPSGKFLATRVGNMVTLSFRVTTGSGSPGGVITISADLPAAYRPLNEMWFNVGEPTPASQKIRTVGVIPDGTIGVYQYLTTGSFSGFAASTSYYFSVSYIVGSLA